MSTTPPKCMCPTSAPSGTREALVRVLNSLGLLGAKQSPLAFIVHGHDETALLELKNYIQNTLKWREPIALREQPSCGKTLVENSPQQNLRADSGSEVADRVNLCR
jgi:hypothetical protein